MSHPPQRYRVPARRSNGYPSQNSNTLVAYPPPGLATRHAPVPYFNAYASSVHYPHGSNDAYLDTHGMPGATPGNSATAPIPIPQAIAPLAIDDEATRALKAATQELEAATRALRSATQEYYRAGELYSMQHTVQSEHRTADVAEQSPEQSHEEDHGELLAVDYGQERGRPRRVSMTGIVESSGMQVEPRRARSAENFKYNSWNH